MANKSLFSSLLGPLAPSAETVNAAGGKAYALTPKQALAQYAATGCLNSTFYADAQTQLQTLIELASQVEPEFVAQVALHARSRGSMKDTPALLVALLSVLSPGLMAEVFDRVIDSPKMLRNFVQIMRSGQVGRKSLGTLPKRLVLQWLENRTDEQVFRASIGSEPSLADIVKMVHPKPATASRAALYAYLLGRPYDATALPSIVRAFEAFKADPQRYSGSEIPDVPMDMLTSLPLDKRHWKALARKASWQSLRMNLNTFARHGAFEDGAVVADCVRRLRDPGEIAKARVLPYQLLAAYSNTAGSVPPALRDALQDAMEIAVANVPTVAGKVWVLPDVSGSMHAPITGHRAGSTTAMRCVDVAALVAAAILRKNPDAGVLPFSDAVVSVDINARDSIMTNAQKLASLPSGGTNCSAPLAELNRRRAAADLVIFVSDNESWMDRTVARGTATMQEWQQLRARNPRAKLVCLDLQPNTTTQAPDRSDVLNIGGFSDAVFTIIAEFHNGTLAPDHWVSVIEKESI
jgi:60 kDa SS-A/Ro ribonucleoprotein